MTEISQHLSPESNEPLLEEQKRAIIELVDARVQDEAAVGYPAESACRDFGLAEDAYDVYVGKEHLFGGFTKFISKENPADVIHGVTWPTMGGNMVDPTRGIVSNAIRTNGDLIRKEHYEGPEGDKIVDITHSPNDPGDSYSRLLENLLDKAKEGTRIANRDLEAIPAQGTELQARKVKVGEKIGRLFSLRKNS